jgi:hypothetical protein
MPVRIVRLATPEEKRKSRVAAVKQSLVQSFALSVTDGEADMPP